ncbi:hypothetical protein HZB88_05330 [archaeon]|nr:hypothetical protein [archaeon]
MPEELITYEMLYELLRREKYKVELQRLDLDFLKKVEQYFKEKKAILFSQEKKDSMFAASEIEKTRIQLKNVQKIIKEIYERREQKIMLLALFFSKTSELPDITVMLKEELAMFNEVKDVLGRHKKEMLEMIEEKEKPKVLKAASLVRVKFTMPMQEFVGTDLKTYGPFEANEIVQLPKSIADFLIKNKQAEMQDEDTKED